MTFAHWLTERDDTATEADVYDYLPLTCGELSCPVWRAVTDAAQAEIDALNADAYTQQIDAMIHEAEPMIGAWMRVNAYYLKYNAQYAKQYGVAAQALFNETRARIEREAGI